MLLLLIALSAKYWLPEDFRTILVGAFSSLLIYIFGLIVQSRKNVEGPRAPIKYLEYPTEISKATKEVFVYTTFLRSLSCKKEHSDEKDRWYAALKTVCEGTEVTVKFSFLDPDKDNEIASVAVKTRQRELKKWADEEKKDEVNVREMIKQNLWTLYCWVRYEGFKNIVVCKYSRTPPLSILQADSVYSIAPYEIKPLDQTERFNAYKDSSLGKFIRRMVDDLDTDICSAVGDNGALVWFDEVLVEFQTSSGTVEKSFPYVVMDDKKAFAAWIDHHYSGKYYEVDGLEDEIPTFHIKACSKENRFTKEVVTGQSIWPGSGPDRTSLELAFKEYYEVDVHVVRFFPIGIAQF